MLKFKFTLSIGIVGARQEEELGLCDIGYIEEEWFAMTGDAKKKALEEAWQDWSNNYIDGGWTEIEAVQNGDNK